MPIELCGVSGGYIRSYFDLKYYLGNNREPFTDSMNFY